MTEHFSFIPPPELIEDWIEQAKPEPWRRPPDPNVLCTLAAQWGADQELEACCDWMKSEGHEYEHEALFAARRPKPKSLKEQALALINDCTDPHGDYLDDNALSIIRTALEALPDD